MERLVVVAGEGVARAEQILRRPLDFHITRIQFCSAASLLLATCSSLIPPVPASGKNRVSRLQRWEGKYAAAP